MPGNKKEAVQVGGHHILPFLIRHKYHQVIPGNPGIINKDADLSIRIGIMPLIQSTAHLLRIGDIKAQQLSTSSGAPDFFKGIPGFAFIGPVIHNYMVSITSKPDSDCLAYSP